MVNLQNEKEKQKNSSDHKKNNAANKITISAKELQKMVDGVRNHLIEKYNKEILSFLEAESKRLSIKDYIKATMSSLYPEYNKDGIIERIYDDIFGFSILDKYLESEEVEEINGNAWNDIEVVTREQTYKIPESFNSPEHAINILKKMALLGKATLDEAYPIRDSYIGTGLRLSVMTTPVVDDQVGVAFSLRILKDREISKSDLIVKYESYSAEEIAMISTFARYGVSMIFGGATSSGKTSDIQTIFKDIAQEGELKLYVIEENSRELNLVHQEDGKCKSRTIHTKTRPIKTENGLNVNSDNLVKAALRHNPDIIITAETRGEEALASVEAALTGHSVITSMHIKSVTAAYKRTLRLCRKADPGSTEDMLMEDIVAAFPIVIFKKQLDEDNSRKCMRIFEATGYNSKTKKIKGRILRRFQKTGLEDGKVVGEHQIVSPISHKLSQILFENGCPETLIKKYNPEFKIDNMQDYIEEFEDE